MMKLAKYLIRMLSHSNEDAIALPSLDAIDYFDDISNDVVDFCLLLTILDLNNLKLDFDSNENEFVLICGCSGDHFSSSWFKDVDYKLENIRCKGKQLSFPLNNGPKRYTYRSNPTN